MIRRPAILDRLRGVQRAGKGWLAYCPAHDDQHKRSLSVGVGDDERTLVNCHAAGCQAEQITAAVGMTLADLAPPSDNRHHPPARRVLAIYDYSDERGMLLYQAVRLEPKDFRCRRPDGRGGWAWNLHDVRVVPYRLAELAEAKRVYIVEGEKDADALVAAGLAATTNHGGAGKWREEHTRALVAAAVLEVVVVRDNDSAGEAHAAGVARACLAAGLRVKRVELDGLPAKGDVSDWLAAGHPPAELESLVDASPIFEPGPPIPPGRPEGPELRREGLDLALVWPDGVRFTLSAIRDGRDGVRGELTVTRDGQRLSWTAFATASAQARETLRKKLESRVSDVPWGDYLEEAAWRLTQAAREGEPIVTLTGAATSPTRELLPRLLYEGEPTLIFGDGDTGKSLVGLTLATGVHSGAGLPFGLKPAQAVPAAYLDWETSRDTLELRLALVAAGLGIDPPALLYKRMTRPLADEAGALAADFARRGIGFVVIDSMMFAVAGGDGAAFHEPITAFYNALRLFAPAASLVLSHVTNADARTGGAARPFGGAFAFNGPRLIWEAKRDRDVTDATAIAFTCTKANNLARRPDPFGLRFVPGDRTITVYPFDLETAAPQITAGASLTWRLRLALAGGDNTTEALAKELDAKPETVKKALQRGRGKTFALLDGNRWGLVPR